MPPPTDSGLKFSCDRGSSVTQNDASPTHTGGNQPRSRLCRPPGTPGRRRTQPYRTRRARRTGQPPISAAQPGRIVPSPPNQRRCARLGIPAPEAWDCQSRDVCALAALVLTKSMTGCPLRSPSYSSIRTAHPSSKLRDCPSRQCRRTSTSCARSTRAGNGRLPPPPEDIERGSPRGRRASQHGAGAPMSCARRCRPSRRA